MASPVYWPTTPLIKQGDANNTPKAACSTYPLTTQHTMKQDVRALADGRCKNTKPLFHSVKHDEKKLSGQPVAATNDRLGCQS